MLGFKHEYIGIQLSEQTDSFELYKPAIFDHSVHLYIKPKIFKVSVIKLLV